MKNTFITAALLLVSCIASAQIGLGTKSYGGNINLTYNSIKLGRFDSKLTNLSITPEFGKFIGKKTEISFEPVIQHFIVSNSSSSATIFGLGVGLRHFFNPVGKIKYFGSIGLGYTYINRAEQGIATGALAFGGTKFIANSLAITGRLNYAILTEFEESVNLFQLSFGLENFINAESTTGEGAELTAKGRKLIGGGLVLGVVNEIFTATINPQFGYFVSKNFLLGAELGLSIIDENTSFVGNALLRYYLPIGKKLFFYPQVRGGWLSISNFSSQSLLPFSNSGLGFDASIGFNYFLRKNIAFECEIAQYRYADPTSSYSFGPNIGLRYYID